MGTRLRVIGPPEFIQMVDTLETTVKGRVTQGPYGSGTPARPSAWTGRP
jgi:hypothetical protein